MNDLNNLIKHVYDTFQQKYGTDTGDLGAGSLFFAFERLPTTVSASDFKLRSSDPSFNPAVALKRGSELVNFTAAIDPEGFIGPRGDISPAVDEQYKLLINGANPVPSGGQEAFFLQLKGQAREDFEKLMQNMDFTEFWPALFTPQFWFDDQDPGLWTRYSSSEGQSTNPDTPTPVIPPQVILTDWTWRVIPPELNPDWEVITQAHRIPTSVLVKTGLLTTRINNSVPSFALDTGDLTLRARINTEPVHVLTDVTNVVTDVTIQPMVTELSEPELRQAQLTALHLKTAAYQKVVLELPEKPVTSNSFSLSFDYCLVNVARPWLSANFLNAANWYGPGLPSGALAGGKYESTARPFAFLPAKFLVIKNLNISAQWSETDRQTIEKSASLGPFSMVSRSFDGATLSCPSMQIIAWFCQVMPVLPPAADPTLTV